MEVFSEEVMSSSELLQAHSLLWSNSVHIVRNLSLKCVIELGIPDIIHKHDQPISLSKLISALPIHPSKAHCIYRIMRILVHSGFFSTRKLNGEEEESYSLTNVSRLLLSDGPAFIKMKSFFLFHLLPEVAAPWHSLSTWLQHSDGTTFEHGNGKNFWDCLADEPKHIHLFNEAMANDSQLIAKVILTEYKNVFEGLETLVDVGGGTGTMAKAIASTFPHIKCTVFDLPHVVANLEATDNLNFIGGNMFTDTIPPTDGILLKWILHDWNDEDSVSILKRCREAILRNGKGGKVIVIEMVIENQNTNEITGIQLSYDVMMMGSFFGKERNLVEWEKLFFEAGFSHYKINAKMGARSLIELYP
ncbi:Tabersonine 16-O-methyltransferase [Morus notabilis]|uniref:Tabersonine 16-O-methyltransferase n=1 Tax=Morus notabilis TaxID=981085 RepID=W9RHE4_9ROSA|nr:probable O-methyltransferase 3 [Morus notabilis]EXB54964.1 Tabersonine 16-O-methyltransferase [Morus notabilis]